MSQKNVTRPAQVASGFRVPRTHAEQFAEALKKAEREYREAQAALDGNSSDVARTRYAEALAHYDQLNAMFPFVAAGAGDHQA